MTLTTLADVRTLLDHLPAGHREKATWRHVADRLDEAARGAPAVEVFALLRTVLAWKAFPRSRIDLAPPPWTGLPRTGSISIAATRSAASVTAMKMFFALKFSDDDLEAAAGSPTLMPTFTCSLPMCATGGGCGTWPGN
jgi:hypothetical protein